MQRGKIDEQWSYVGNKGDVVWHLCHRRALHQAGRGLVRRRSLRRDLPQAVALPADYRKRGIFYTDEYFVYRQVLPASRHRPRPKGL
jgi:IS1 family transposase